MQSQTFVAVVHEVAVARLLVLVRIATGLKAETTEPACDAGAGSLDHQVSSCKDLEMETTNSARKRSRIGGP